MAAAPTPSRRSRIAARALVALAAAASAWLLAAGFRARSRLAAVEERTRTVEADIRAGEGATSATSALEDRALFLRETESRALETLPNSQQREEFLQNLTRLLTISGLQLESGPAEIGRSREVAPGIFTSTFRIASVGDSSAILRFVNLVEIDPRMVSVVRAEIVADARVGDGGVPAHRLVAELEVHHFQVRTELARVQIPREAERMEDPRMVSAINSYQPERASTYTLRPSASRRDPFVDPTAPAAGKPPMAALAEPVGEEAVVSDLERSFARWEAAARAASAVVASGAPFPAEPANREAAALAVALRIAVDRAVERGVVSSAPHVARLEAVRRAIARGDTRVEVVLSADAAKKALASISQALAESEPARALDLATAWGAAMRGARIDETARPLVDEIADRRAEAMLLEVLRALGRSLTSTRVDPVAARSVVTVGDEEVRIGKWPIGVEATLEVVEEDGAWFRYLGRRVRLAVRAKSEVTK